MRAAVVTRYGGAPEVVDHPVPAPGPGDVLMRVRASGLCSTDLHLTAGRQPLGALPRVLGHELAGDIAALGEGVVDWRIDDRVTAALDVTCGHCRDCRTGETQRCRSMRRIGFELDGGHAEYAVVPAANLVGLPDEVAFEAAAILPDAVACAYHCLVKQGRVRMGQVVLVLGVGGLGIHAVQIARLAGAQCMATSRRPDRLALAERYGAVPVNPAHVSIEDAVARFTDGEGVDLVVDMVGTRESVREGLCALRPGGKLVAVAYVDESFEVPSMRLFAAEQEIVGCRGSTKQDLVDVVGLVQTGCLEPVVGATYPLEELARAIACLEAGEMVGRIVLTRPT